MPSLPPSDKRVAGGVTRACVMCENVCTLRLGHVVPKWMHEWVKAEGGGRIHGKYPSLGIPHAVTQDGEKHYLLCDTCEEFMSVAEGYMRTVMIGSVDERSSVGVLEARGGLTGVRFDLVQRFMLGVALRGHFATGGVFHSARLPTAMLPRVRRAVVHGPISDAEFPIFAVRFVSSLPGVDPKAALVTDYRQVGDYAPIFRLIGGGWDWTVFLCGDDPRGAKELFNLRLRAEGMLPVYVQEFTENPSIRSLFGLKEQRSA